MLPSWPCPGCGICFFHGLGTAPCSPSGITSPGCDLEAAPWLSAGMLLEPLQNFLSSWEVSGEKRGDEKRWVMWRQCPVRKPACGAFISAAECRLCLHVHPSPPSDF